MYLKGYYVCKMVKEQCLRRNKNWSTSRLDIMQLIAPTCFFRILSHISFSACYGNCQEMFNRNKLRKIHPVARLNIGSAPVICVLGESSVPSLLQVCFVLAYSFFLNGPEVRNKSARKKNVLFSLPWTALLIHERISGCLLRKRGQSRPFPSLYTLIQCNHKSSAGMVPTMQPTAAKVQML